MCGRTPAHGRGRRAPTNRRVREARSGRPPARPRTRPTAAPAPPRACRGVGQREARLGSPTVSNQSSTLSPSDPAGRLTTLPTRPLVYVTMGTEFNKQLDVFRAIRSTVSPRCRATSWCTVGYAIQRQSRSITSPVDFRRYSRRSSMYVSSATRAPYSTFARTTDRPLVLRAGPSRTLIVVSNDDTVAPFSTSQFQPPSDELLPEQPLDEWRHLDAEVRAGRDDVRVDARFDLAQSKNGVGRARFEFGVAPRDVLTHEPDGPLGLLARRIESDRVAGTPGRGTCRCSPRARGLPPHCPSGHLEREHRAPDLGRSGPLSADASPMELAHPPGRGSASTNQR